MKFRALTIAVIATVLSTNVFALTHKRGVVESVNLEENTISITANNGKTQSYKLADSAKVHGAESIKPGQVVTLKISGLEKEKAAKPNFVAAEIISVNAEANTAVVREKRSGDLRTVSFSEDVVVRGKVESVAALSEGHLVKVRYAATK